MLVRVINKPLKLRKERHEVGARIELRENNACNKALVAMGRIEIVVDEAPLPAAKAEPPKKKKAKKKASK